MAAFRAFSSGCNVKFLKPPFALRGLSAIHQPEKGEEGHTHGLSGALRGFWDFGIRRLGDERVGVGVLRVKGLRGYYRDLNN